MSSSDDDTMIAPREAAPSSDDQTLPPPDTSAAEPSAFDATMAADRDATSSNRGTAGTAGTAGQPERIGRFVILQRLGAGGMGVVYGAYDDELDRRVAIKLLHGGGGAGELARARLHREAQAMARLNHPNVIQVYDVGTHDGRVFVAMEFVRGRTLTDWLATEPAPTWQAVLDRMIQAGRGLQAAHRTGLVHRDFKPDNAMVGDDGRVRVLDFGLARNPADETDSATGVAHAGELFRTQPDAADRADGEPRTDDSQPAEVSKSRRSVERLTLTGAVVGTPAYMAPEQWESGELDARTDQFSFCVVVWQALYGERPFRGTTVPELARAVMQGDIAAPTKVSEAPARFEAILRRGLSTDSAQRWPDMNALLAALADDPIARRRRIVGVGAALAAVGVLGFSAARITGSKDESDGCASLATLVGGLTPERVTAIDRAFRATGVPYAARSWSTARSEIEAWSSQLGALRVQTCEAKEARRMSDELHDLTMGCLDERAHDLTALLAVLSAADATTVDEALRATASMRAPQACADAEYLRALVPPPSDPQERAAVDAAEAKLARARITVESGHYADGLQLAKAVETEATLVLEGARRHPPLVAETAFALGLGQASTGQAEPAAEALRRAAVGAIEVGDARLLGEAAMHLSYVLGNELGETERGLDWGRQAKAVARRFNDDELLSRALNNIGSTLETADDNEGAVAAYEEGLRIAEANLGPQDYVTFRFHNNLGAAAHRRGELAAAETSFMRGRAIIVATHGEDHPQRFLIDGNLVALRQERGDHEGAIELGEATLKRQREVVGEHPDLAATAQNLANAHMAIGNHERAIELVTEAIAILDSAIGPRSMQSVPSYDTKARMARDAGELAVAEAVANEADAIVVERLGADHGSRAWPLNTLGTILERSGRRGEARTAHEEGRRVALSLGENHPILGVNTENLGKVDAAEGKHAEALRRYEEAIAVYGAAGSPPDQIAACLVNMARSHSALGHVDDAVLALEGAVPDLEGVELLSARLDLVEALRRVGRDQDAATELDTLIDERDAIENAELLRTLDRLSLG